MVARGYIRRSPRSACVFGRALNTNQLGETLLPKRIALPVFASDALSSNAYATQEIMLVLSLGGVAFFAYAPWVAAAVVCVFFVVVASYRQNVHAYPSGGGDYEVVSANLGPRAGVFVASALLVDYILTVAVSISSAVANIASTFEPAQQHKVALAIALVVLLALMNLRGVRESGTAFAIPTYAFMFAVFTMLIWAAVRLFARATSCSPSRRSGNWSPRTPTPDWPWRSSSPARSRRAPRRSPGSRRSATACPPSRSPRATTPPRRC